MLLLAMFLFTLGCFLSVSGSQDFRPPPISSNGGVSKRQTSK